ncbi:MAG TPA: helix-turn-helix transcriptional regulator [Candidatus Faecousia intestinigallinarum]|nr:helix-turn-helix transcriptional regulator [Candidatus Faecousia intestinigallinarum]
MVKNLRKLRMESGTTQRQLADLLHVSQQAVNRYEHNDAEPSIRRLILLADYFGVSVDELIGHEPV